MSQEAEQLEKTSFTVHEIAKVMFKAGAHERMVAFEICGLFQLLNRTLSYEELVSIMTEASDEYEQEFRAACARQKEFTGASPTFSDVQSRLAGRSFTATVRSQGTE